MSAPIAARQTAATQRADFHPSQVHRRPGAMPGTQAIRALQRTVGNRGMHHLLKPVIQRICTECVDEDKKEIVQAKRPTDTPEVPPDLASYLDDTRGGGAPLPPSARAYLEPRFGYDFSGVRVHTDGHAADAAQALSAQAFTTGSDVYFAAGQYDPGSVGGQRLLSHELTHVVQQTAPTASAVRRAPRTIQRLGDLTKRPAALDLRCPLPVGSPHPVTDFVEFPNLVTSLSALDQAKIENVVLNWHAAGTNQTVRVDGFASQRGGDAANWELSCARAEAVAAELRSPSSGGPGIPAAFIVVFAHGETAEFGAEDRNRRATITLSGGTAPTPTPPGPATPPPAPPSPATLTDLECARQVARGLGTAWLAALPDCPCTTGLVATENTTLPAADRWTESSIGLDCFHPGANTCFRRDSGGHAQQCCYDGTGNLITAGAAAGTPDFVPSSGSGHQSTDVWTFRQLGWAEYGLSWVPNQGVGCPANTVTNAQSCWFWHWSLASRPPTCAP